MARLEADILTAIADMEQLLDSGALSTNIDGQQVTFQSASALRKRLRELRNELAAVQGKQPPRPPFRRFDLA